LQDKHSAALSDSKLQEVCSFYKNKVNWLKGKCIAYWLPFAIGNKFGIIMTRVLSGREEILRVERRFYTDSFSSVNKTLSTLEQKFKSLHARELIGESRMMHYRFELLRIRCMICHTAMQRDKAAIIVSQLKELAIATKEPLHHAHLSREEYRLRSDIELQSDDDRILREALETFMLCGEMLHAFRCALTLAQHAQKKDKYAQCLYYLQKAEEIRRMLSSEPFLEAQYQLANGNYHIAIQDFDKAEECLQAAIKLSVDEQNWRTELVARSNIASIHLMRVEKKPQQALEILLECMELAKKKKAFHDLSRILVMCGSAQTNMGNYGEALAFFHQAEKLYKKYPFPLHEATLHYKLARLFMSMNASSSRNAKIEHHFRQAHIMTQEHGFLQLRIWVLRHWGLWLRSRKKWDRAFALLQESYETQQVIIGKDAQKNIKELEVHYVASLHQKENELLKQENHILGKETRDLRYQLLERTSSIMKELNRYGEVRSTIMEILEQHGTKAKVLKEVSALLMPLSVTQLDKEIFFSEFNQTYPGFYNQLEYLIPDVTIKEKHICCLIRCGFSTYHIATFLDISTRTVETHRLHIRKKAGLSSSDTIDRLLSSI
jgi:tetratricopeptide (TPR) repeat protein/DNA-binding CsgD family transcriptional regulator